MITSYKDFLFESLILESNLIFSKKFKDLISKIESPVAKALGELENKDLSITNNYIDISDDKEQISFITDRKAKELLNTEKNQTVYYSGSGGGILRHTDSNKDIFALLEYEPIGQRAYTPNNSEKGEVLKSVVSPVSGTTYLKIQFPGGISVINQRNVNIEDVSELPFKLNRQQIRVGRGIRGILNSAKLNFTDTEIEKFVNLYKSEWDKMNDIFKSFEVVKGNQIPEWYSWRTYELERSKGTLSNSCMCSAPVFWFNIYSKNPDKVSMVILKSDSGDKIKGRAILWKLDKPEITFMDRIYTHNDSDVHLFREYAKKMGWHTKPNNNYLASSETIDPKGELIIYQDLVVHLKAGEEYFPYLDTLKYYEPETGRLSVDQPESSFCYTLNDTDGRYEEYESACDQCGGDGRVECWNCDGLGDFECDECDGTGKIKNDEGNEEKCDECGGRGKNDCTTCDGECRLDCPDC